MTTVTCFIKYKLDPYKLKEFEAYAQVWLDVIPQCGGDLVGYWMPHEGTNYEAMALISFKSMADYETYRAALRKNDAGMANFTRSQEQKFILEESRAWLRKVEKPFQH
jgi:hypothetical protein